MRLLPVLSLLLLPLSCTTPNEQAADLILTNAAVYTLEEDQPWASTVVIKENRITAVLDEAASFDQFEGPATQVINLEGKFMVPGFIDAHTHFSSAGALLVDVNLLKVSDDEGLRAELQRVVGVLEAGEWITGGLWGAYEQWAEGTAEASARTVSRWKPTRQVIDDLTPQNPCLLRSFDSELFLANTLALEAAGLEEQALEGMEVDPNGEPTGLILRGSPALDQIRAVVKEKSHARLMQEHRAALQRLRESGVVEIHDITFPEQTARYVELQEEGDLSVRVWLRPDLARAQEFLDKGLTRGMHPVTKQPDPFLRYGAFKGYIDGIMGNHTALFFEPYDDQPDNYGSYRHHTSDERPYKKGNMEKIYQYLLTAQQAGMVGNVHAIGTRGSALMLDTYERLMNDLGQDLERYRVIHSQVLRPEDFPRFKALNVIAEVNPYHVSDDMRWMEERIGFERSKGTYAFKTLLENGATLTFGSDWPGTSAAEYYVHPKYLLHAAVTRTTLDGLPEGGWFPEQKISMHEALKAYTINGAYAAFEDSLRGSIKVGKMADLAVCDRNLMSIPPEDILNMNIDMTIIDGKIVYSRL